VDLLEDGPGSLGTVGASDNVPLDLRVLALGGDAQKVLHARNNGAVNLVGAGQGELLVEDGEVRSGSR